MNGLQTPAQIAKACEPVMRIQAGLGAELCVIVFDRETSATCPGALATDVGREVAARSPLPAAVVVKDQKVENWVIADISTLATMRARFRVSAGDRRAIEPDRADRVDALAMLKRMAIRKAYDKVDDGKRILDAADARRIGRNSRSFRKLMSVIGHPQYSTQSRLP
jgi:hypothetical protein